MNFLKRIFSGRPQIDWTEVLSRNPQIIDVRSPAEFKSGHAKNSINIPLGEIGTKIGEFRAAGKPIITCCASGHRSGVAQRKLEALGVEAYNGGPWQRVNQMLK